MFRNIEIKYNAVMPNIVINVNKKLKKVSVNQVSLSIILVVLLMFIPWIGKERIILYQRYHSIGGANKASKTLVHFQKPK